MFPTKIGICVPAHNEQAYSNACLNHLYVAVNNTPLPVITLVVLDTCTDATKMIVTARNIQPVECQSKQVGIVRHLGVLRLIEMGCDWIACTDADTVVASDWLSKQLTLLSQRPDTDMICGGVKLMGDSTITEPRLSVLEKTLLPTVSDKIVYGANLSFSANAYLTAGGFKAVSFHEDVKLCQSFKEHNLTIAYDPYNVVHTSQRCESKTPRGLGNDIANFNQLFQQF